MSAKSLFLVCSFAVLPLLAQTGEKSCACQSKMTQNVHKIHKLMDVRKLARVAAVQSIPSKPVAEWVCADFLEVAERFQPYAVVFADSMSKAGAPEKSIIDVEGLQTLVPYMVTVCERNPAASFTAKVKATSDVMGVGSMPMAIPSKSAQPAQQVQPAPSAQPAPSVQAAPAK